MDVMNTSSRYFTGSPRGSAHQPTAHSIGQSIVFNLSRPSLVLVVIFLMTGMSLTTWRTTKRRKGAKILPGPWGGYWYIIQKHDLKITGFPFIGRVHDVDPTKPWVKITEWCSKYDGLFQTKMMGDTHIWISSTEIAHELLNKRYEELDIARHLIILKFRSLKIQTWGRASNYSSRPMVPAVPGSDTQDQYLPLLGTFTTVEHVQCC